MDKLAFLNCISLFPPRQHTTAGRVSPCRQHICWSPKVASPTRRQSPTAAAEKPKQREALLVVDHGSKRAAANAHLEDLGTTLRARSTVPVFTAHMELASPTILDGIRAAVANGATHIVVVPFFLSPGRHAMSDIPSITAEAVSAFGGVTYEVRDPIGTHPAIADVVLDRAGLSRTV